MGSNLIVNLVDKLMFGGLLLLTLQIPMISDHYLQFISGYYESTKSQVDGFKENASIHEYSDVYAMIEDLLKDPKSVVRADAAQKLHTLHEYEQLTSAIDTLKNGNIFDRAWFMFNPSRWSALEKVMENFKPGIPLSLKDLLYSALTSLAFSSLIAWPLKRLVTRKKLEIHNH